MAYLIVQEHMVSMGYGNWREEDAEEAYGVYTRSREDGVDDELECTIPHSPTLRDTLCKDSRLKNIYFVYMTR